MPRRSGRLAGRRIDYGEDAMIDRYLGPLRRQRHVFEDTESERKYTLVDSDIPSLPSDEHFEPGSDTGTESTESSTPAPIAEPPRRHVELSPLLVPPPKIDPYLYRRFTAMNPLTDGYVVGSYMYDKYQKFKKEKKNKKTLEITQSVVQEVNGSRSSTRVRNFTTHY